MSIDAAALTVLTILAESASDSTGYGVELPLGFNGFIAPMHPGMDLANVQMTGPPMPVHGADMSGTVNQLLGDVMSRESSASTTVLEDMAGSIVDESA